jgi:hypothetical protein
MNPEVYAIIITPIVTLFLGVLCNKLAEDRPKLVTYISHASMIQLDPQKQGSPSLQVHTHSLVVRNTGRKPAKNVRIGHNLLPNFQVFPKIQYEVVSLPNGGKEILIPILVPREQITINYLYYPPLIWREVNTTEKSEEGLARRVGILLTRRHPKWFRFLSVVMFLLGLATFIYWIIRLVIAITT